MSTSTSTSTLLAEEATTQNRADQLTELVGWAAAQAWRNKIDGAAPLGEDGEPLWEGPAQYDWQHRVCWWEVAKEIRSALPAKDPWHVDLTAKFSWEEAALDDYRDRLRRAEDLVRRWED